MNRDHHIDRPPAEGGRARVNAWQQFLFWLAGACNADMLHLSERTHLKVVALGIAFGIGLLCLVFAWIHVGMTYFGWLGIIVPGVAVPAAMVLGLDRLFAMQTRRLTAELAPYNQASDAEEIEARKNQRRARMATALVFSGVTVYTLLLSLSQDGIQQAHRDTSNKANAQLRASFEERVEAEHALNDGALSQRLEELQTQRTTLLADVAQAGAAAKASESAALKAQTEASKEAGGLEDRATGTGPKYHAQREIEAQHRAAAATQQLNAVNLRQRVDAIDQSVDKLNQQRKSLRTSTDSALLAVPEAIKADPGYVPVKAGLFADSAAFIRLYSDHQEGPGYWVLTLMGAPFLFALECLPLLALAIYGSSPLDVYRMAHNRAEAAGAVAEAEVQIARDRAAMPPVRVAYPRKPVPGKAPIAQPADAPQSSNKTSGILI